MNRVYNILNYIETSGPGGAETVLLNIARNVDRDKYNPTAILPKSDWLHEQLSKSGIATEIIPSKRAWDMAFLLKLTGYCRRHKIDLIHSHLFGANLYSCMAGAILRLPVIATFHNELFFQGRTEKFLKLKSMIIRRFASKMVFVAEYMKKDYLEHSRFPDNKSLIIYNGIELGDKAAAFDPGALKKELGIADDDLLVGHVANFRGPKGHMYLLESARIVCRKIPCARFLLIGEEGDGNIKRQIEDFVAGNGLEKNVRILGFRKDVARLLKLMDVFVLSSTTEGMPLSVIEAMASSKAVVVTDVGGLSEIVIQDQTGFLVEPRNPQALADQLTTLLEDGALRSRMGAAGRRVAESRFSLRAMIERYQDLYEELIG